MTHQPGDLKRHLAHGVLAFPATPFLADGSLDREGLARHVADLAAHSPLALVPAGGAGELFSLGLSEHQDVAHITVKQAAGLPVIVGVGNGLAIACDMARGAERAGADAVLLLPPYLTTSEQGGLFAHIKAVCDSIGIGVIAYSRNNGVLTTDTALRLADACENFIGLKDGTGDFESLNQLVLKAGDRFAVINGVPTAEILAAQCFSIGIRAYSSAVFTFAPLVAKRFFEAIDGCERDVSDWLMAELYLPLVALRNRRRGYAVSLVKGGLKAVGRSAGPVRPPLVDLAPNEVEEMARLIERATAFVETHKRAAPAANLRVPAA